MKFYSETLDKFFDSEKACIEAEVDAKRKADEFEKEKAAAQAKLERETDRLTEMYVEYLKKYEGDSPLIQLFTSLEKANIRKPQTSVKKMSEDEFVSLLDSFLK
jgi:hypothetical protein